MKALLSGLFALAVVAVAGAADDATFGPAECEGVYPGHLQGICTDGQGALFWSWTTRLVKTDPRGRVLASVPVVSHHGDLCHRDGRIYVAVNLGKFNEPPGQADSWVYGYDAATLAEVSRHAVPEAVHGAGGIAWHDGTFLVVGGLPPGVNENHLYEYDAGFRFRARHVLPTGYTYKGIQTATWADGAWWFGTYGDTRWLLRVDADFRLTGRWKADVSLGIVPVGVGRFLIGKNTKDAEGGHAGRVTLCRFDAERGLVAVP